MIKIAHRINTITALRKIPIDWGVEVDVRHDNRNGRLYLNHDPGVGEDLERYLRKFNHAFIIFDIKESGVEDRVIDLASKYRILKSKYFLLDVEFPYLYTASRKNIKQIAVRYSKDEPIEMALKYKNKVDWVWIDTNTKLPLDLKIKNKLKGFKTCLVSPDRWGRPEDIPKYRMKMKKLGFKLDAVMAGFEHRKSWE